MAAAELPDGLAGDGDSGPGAASQGGARPPSGPGADDDAPQPEWADLPAIVRTAVIAVAARALGAVPADQVPTALAPVARFTPGKRARLGAGPLARVLEQDTGFRALVAQHLPPVTAATDAAALAAHSYLLRLPDAAERVAAAAREDEIAMLRGRVAELTTTIEELTARLAALADPATGGGGQPRSGRSARTGRAATGAQPATGPADAEESAELERLRRRLRDQGARVKTAEQAAQAAADEVRRVREEAEARIAREQASTENWRGRAEREAQRADAARQALDRLRDQAGEERAIADRRLGLLLDAVEQAAAGLRREWRLATGGPAPADVVARRLPGVDTTRARSADPALLLDWLALPGAHLIVDGYNVTKSGFPELSLADQRDRLTRLLSTLAARTGAEITVVFDGAAVVAAPVSTRGVRVLFSPPGVIADDVIRQLAGAEPAGRVVVVVSSDREVVDGVRRSGARTAPSAVLLQVLS
jgi:hypothetical protein